MSKVKVYSQAGDEVDEIELPAVFDVSVNRDLLHQVVSAQTANARQVTASTKGRGDVRGGGRKPWRQKGTGRARHGSIRSPIWKGGGVTHGPTAERDFSKKINKKMAAKALAMAIASKARDGELILFDELSVAGGRTKEAVGILSDIAKRNELHGISTKTKVLALPAEMKAEARAFRNIRDLNIEGADSITARGILQKKYLIMLKASLRTLEKRVSVKSKIKYQRLK